ATYSEWVCLEHQGYARQKAAEWWRKRAPGCPVPLSVAEALAQTGRLGRPSDISVRPSSRYLEISGDRFFPCAHPTPGLCAVCHREPRGFGWFNSDFRRTDPPRDASRKRLCSRAFTRDAAELSDLVDFPFQLF